MKVSHSHLLEQSRQQLRFDFYCICEVITKALGIHTHTHTLDFMTTISLLFIIFLISLIMSLYST